MSLPSKTTQGSKLSNEANERAVKATIAALDQTISAADLTHISNRPITEVEALKQEVAAVIPAGNIVGLVMSGLLRLRGRTLPTEQAKSDISALLRGLEVLPNNLVSNTIYGTFVAGPAAALAAYQKLLTLTGKSPESAFPEGLWQFYLEFALREDTARHANETVGFQRTLQEQGWQLSEADQLAAWVCAVSQICFRYDDLLDNEWREQTYLNLLNSTAEAAGMKDQIHFQRLNRAWAAQRPYRRGQDVRADEDYVLYRRRRFENFFRSRFTFLPAEQQAELEAAYADRREAELVDYQKQMTILATLTPERYRENRSPIPLWQVRVGIIHRGAYYLLPICHTDRVGRPMLYATRTAQTPTTRLQFNEQGALCDYKGQLLHVDRLGQIYDADNKRYGYLRPVSFQSIRRQVAAILNQRILPGESPFALDEQLVAIRRSNQESARRTLKDPAIQQAIQALKYTPIIINWERQPADQPLATIRRGRRGIGDHALTIFRTTNSMVFDQSHIFFDGVWGIAFSEILTGEAISWAAYFKDLPPPESLQNIPQRLHLPYQPALEKFPQDIPPEVSAESDDIHTKNMRRVLKLLPKRHLDLKLTVNDFLLLYRCEFSHEYQPSAKINDVLHTLSNEGTQEAQAIKQVIEEVVQKFQTGNPCLMIPMNAIAAKPLERLYPTTFRNPFTELWPSYKKTVADLQRYEVSQTQSHWMVFNDSRRSLLVQLDYFGRLLQAYKEIALAGGSPSTATMKLFAHVPDALLNLLQGIPHYVDALNEMIKGEELFSNVGRVARGASLTRFISAKDDHEEKGLIWGIMTDDADQMHLSLRDFRPYVATLKSYGRLDLAEMLVEDYVTAFTAGFNQFLAALLDILKANATHAKGGDSHD